MNVQLQSDNVRLQSDYVLGHNVSELQRLIRQSSFYAEFTEDVLRRAGLAAGMRVLDAGCGPGDVSLLAARIVGPAGHVVGVDRSPETLDLARRRAAAEGVRQVTFIEGDLANLPSGESFDALIGRLVLMYLPGPAAVLRELARRVRTGGIVAFQEMDFSAARTEPHMALCAQCHDWICAALQRAGAATEMGPKLYATFRQAGLPNPQMNLHARIGGSDSPIPEYVTGILSTLLPVLERFGIANTDEIGIETLPARLRQEMIDHDGIMILPSLVGAWTTKTG